MSRYRGPAFALLALLLRLCVATDVPATPAKTCEDVTMANNPQCYKNMVWANTVGLQKSPLNYPAGLVQASPIQDFQYALNLKAGKAPGKSWNCSLPPCSPTTPGVDWEAYKALESAVPLANEIHTLPTQDPSATTPRPKCEDIVAKPNSECFKHIVWVNQKGLLKFPDQYPEGLTQQSKISDFQNALYLKAGQNTGKAWECPPPCAPVDSAIKWDAYIAKETNTQIPDVAEPTSNPWKDSAETDVEDAEADVNSLPAGGPPWYVWFIVGQGAVCIAICVFVKIKDKKESGVSRGLRMNEASQSDDSGSDPERGRRQASPPPKQVTQPPTPPQGQYGRVPVSSSTPSWASSTPLSTYQPLAQSYSADSRMNGGKR
jgi:hypothetical protein